MADCPNCGSFVTKVQDVEVLDKHVEVVQTCEDCPTQFVVDYGNPHTRDVVTYDV